jgi:hypothetical protein
MKATGITFFVLLAVCGCTSPSSDEARLRIQNREREKEEVTNSVRDFNIPYVNPDLHPNSLESPDWRKEPVSRNH